MDGIDSTAILKSCLHEMMRMGFLFGLGSGVILVGYDNLSGGYLIGQLIHNENKTAIPMHKTIAYYPKKVNVTSEIYLFSRPFLKLSNNFTFTLHFIHDYLIRGCYIV